MKFQPLILACLLAACSARQESGGVRAPGARPVGEAARTLAYEHTVNLDVPVIDVARLRDSITTQCYAAPDQSCAVLESSLERGQNTYAILRMRASGVTVRQLIAALARSGEVTSSVTKAEDLAAPIVGAERDAAKLTLYRDKLEALTQRPGLDVAALIQLNHELADVQARIESNAGVRARLKQRVELEVLNVRLSGSAEAGFWRPVSAALRDFKSSLANGVAMAITVFAYLLPWAVSGIALWRFVRWWRRR